MERAWSRVVPSSNDPGKVRKGGAKITVGVFMDKTNIVTHGSYLSFRPDCFSMLFSVPVGMGNCDAALFGWMFELHMAARLNHPSL